MVSYLIQLTIINHSNTDILKIIFSDFSFLICYIATPIVLSIHTIIKRFTNHNKNLSSVARAGIMTHSERNTRSAPAGSGRSRQSRIPENFTYISSCVKYTMFFFNFLLWLSGLLLLGIGVYAALDKWASQEAFKLQTVYDVMVNIGFFLMIIGGIVFLVSLAGCIGALRENVCLLKFYSFCILILFLIKMILLALSFYYPHKITQFVETELSENLIRSYRDDLDFQNLLDLVQQEFECCGLSSEGYRDWSKNQYFNCTERKEDNPSAERCGVPFSCCHTTPGGLVNLMCGYNVQALKDTAVVLEKINTRGCIPTIKNMIENNLHSVGGVAIGIVVCQLLVMWLARTLEGQIESQKSLWNRR